MMSNVRNLSAIHLLLTLLMVSCGGSSERRLSATGGMVGVGGQTSTGTTLPVGGGNPTGGIGSLGGSTSDGGSGTTGGGSPGGGVLTSGGASEAGGDAASGGSDLGGNSSAGGSTAGGALATGGAAATGGNLANGGATATGGVNSTGASGGLGTGGATANGGVAATGGVANPGGTTATNGTGGSGGGIPAACGNHIIDNAEGCDDGNTVPGDGCSPLCQREPACNAGQCTSVCGDGVVVAGEDCDDGNLSNGDGCSASCQVEDGYTCARAAATLALPIVYRDFRKGGDFEPAAATGLNAAVQGLVQSTLDAEGKPVFAGTANQAYITSAASFSTWYRDTAGKNSNYTSTLTLWSDDGVAYANRWGSNGERYAYYSNITFCDVSDCSVAACTAAAGQQCFSPCTPYGASYTYACLATNNALDGNPLFFPLDDAPNMITPTSEYITAMIPPPFAPYWQTDPSGARHNFSFTSELKFWFYYQAGQTYSIQFLGDDDVWVFVNRHLALDLGGLHTEVRGHLDIAADGSGNVTISQAEPSPPPAPLNQTVSLGLEDGHVYEVAVFHAERKSTGSAYALTTSGLGLSPSRCSR